MKIGQDWRSQIDPKQVRQATGNKASFDQLVNVSVQRVKQEEIEKLMNDISKQGDKLARFRSFQDLAKFKRMIKDFLQETVYSGLELQESRDFNADGYSQKLTVVKEIDEKLVTLTEDIVNQEKKTIGLLSVIGEIKGLLVNLYT